MMHGVSFGGYWGAKLATVEKNRLRAVVVQSPPVHGFFQPDFVRDGPFNTRVSVSLGIVGDMDVVRRTRPLR